MDMAIPSPQPAPDGFDGHKLGLTRLPGLFLVCRLPATSATPAWALAGSFSSVTRTPHEISIVCAVDQAPVGLRDGLRWIGFELAGPIDLSAVGILAPLLVALARRRVPAFAVSTYLTDYLFVQQSFTDEAWGALQAAGHQIREEN